MAITIDVKDIQGITLHRLLRRDAVEQFVKVLKIVFGIVSVIALALLVAAFVNHIFGAISASTSLNEKIDVALSQGKSVASGKPDEGNNSIIVERNLFGELGPKAKPVDTRKPDKKPPTQLNLALVGTFVGAGDDSAIIEDTKKKEQDVFVRGESIFGEAKLVGIFPNKVEINRNGQIEVLTIDDTPDASGPGGASVEGDESFTVDEDELNQALDNLPLLLTQARAVPYFKDGKAIGLRLFAIKNGSLYEKVGLKNGDILMSINGNSLGDISQAMKLFEKLKEERNITLSLERNKQKKVFSYSID